MIGPQDVLLTGRVAVVTGAVQGIGKATALALEQFGATVIGLDRTAGTDYQVDVRDHEAVAAIAAEIPAVDILVNNAGGTFAAPFESVSPKGDQALVSANLLQVAWTTRAFLPQLSASDAASVINITSIEAHRAAPGFAMYAAAKAGVANLSMTLALELAPIRVNAVSVDSTPTEGIAGRPMVSRSGSPLGWGDPDTVAGAVVFLAGPLSAFTTGSTVHVDGGNLAASSWKRESDGAWRLT